MKSYTKITWWENKRRLQLLHEFREVIITYFNNAPYHWQANGRIENEEAKKARTQINLMIDELHNIIMQSGLNPVVTWTPPPSIGGYIQNINFIANIFNLGYYKLSPDVVIDHIERTIGIYDNNSQRAFIRTINPFFWLCLALDYAVKLPFSLLGKAGFNSKKIEDSLIGKLIKAVGYVITVFAALLTILHLTGYLDEFNLMFRK